VRGAAAETGTTFNRRSIAGLGLGIGGQAVRA
jgi:hypothetical protein